MISWGINRHSELQLLVEDSLQFFTHKEVSQILRNTALSWNAILSCRIRPIPSSWFWSPFLTCYKQWLHYFQFHPGLYFILHYMYCQYSQLIVTLKLLPPYGHSEFNFLNQLAFSHLCILHFFSILWWSGWSSVQVSSRNVLATWFTFLVTIDILIATFNKCLLKNICIKLWTPVAFNTSHCILPLHYLAAVIPHHRSGIRGEFGLSGALGIL